MVFVTLAVSYGRFEQRLMGEKLLGKITQPIPKEGVPVALSFSYVRAGTPPMVQTSVGYLPLHDLTGTLVSGQTTSLSGRLLPNGQIETDFIRYHPLRKMKTDLSLFTVIGGILLGLFGLVPTRQGV